MVKVIGHGGEKMANIKSAKKRISVNAKKKNNNIPKKSSLKTAIKGALKNTSNESVSVAYKKIDQALASNIITKNKAARMKSRVSKNLNNVK